jgi:tetratricopeptide (TPR) repeat protein
MGTRWMAVVAVAAGMALSAACDGRGEDPDRMPLGGEGMEQARAGWSEELEGSIDRGNAAYRDGRYDDAAAYYRQATETAPQVAAGWFGLHMAELARGNHEAAQAALEQAEALTPGLGGGHPVAPDDSPVMELPPGHP